MLLFTPRPAVRWRRWRLTARAAQRPVAYPTVAGTIRVAPSAAAVVVVRRRSPSQFPSRVFARPMALKRLFKHTDAPESVVAMLAAPTWVSAADIAHQLSGKAWMREQSDVVEALCRIALGRTPPSNHWGESAEADALRLRALAGADPGQTDVGWTLFLEWAGQRLQSVPLARLPRPLAAVAVASLAATFGYRRAFQMALPRSGALEGAFADPLALVALRCALAGEFLPQLVGYLIPRPRARHAPDRDPWAAALAALRAYGEQGNVAGLVHLTAALVAADLRERAVGLVPREAAGTLRRRWWAAPDEEDDRALTAAVNAVRSGAVTVTWPVHGPWGRNGGGPRTAAIVEHVRLLLAGGSGARAIEVFLDDRLAVAAVWGVIGYAPSATAQLAEARVPPALREARRALADGLARPMSAGDYRLPLQVYPGTPDTDRVYKRLAGTPDPSVEMASPHWMLGDDRGRLMSRFLATDRAASARAVRSLLDRADLRRDLEPFWILRGRKEESAAVLGLAAWLAAREPSRTTAAGWARFAEDLCRQMQPESE